MLLFSTVMSNKNHLSNIPNTESSETSSKPSTLDIAKFANKAYYARKDREALEQEIHDTFRSFNEQERRRKVERRKKYIGGFAIAAALVFAGTKTAEAVKTLTTPLTYTISGERQVAEGDTLWGYAEDIIQDAQEEKTVQDGSKNDSSIIDSISDAINGKDEYDIREVIFTLEQVNADVLDPDGDGTYRPIQEGDVIKMIKLGETEAVSSPDAKESQIEHTQGSDPSSSGTFVLPEVDK